MGNKQRIISLDVVRALAFLAVFSYHAVNTFPGNGAVYNCFSKSPGVWGVSVFFCLSGYVMTNTYWDKTLECSLKVSFLFSLKKIKRLYPLHLIMLFWGVIYIYLKTGTVSRTIKPLIRTILLVQTWFPVDYQAINSVAWYLSVCLFLYFCFPFVLKIIKNNKNVTLLKLLIVLIFVFRLLVGRVVLFHTHLDIKWVTYIHPIFRLWDFLIGSILVAIRQKTNLKQLDTLKCSLLEIIAIILSIVVCIYYSSAAVFKSWFTWSSLFVPSSVLLIYAFSLDNGVVSRVLKNKAVLWIADISPYAFLVHRLVIYYFHLFVTRVLHNERISFIFVIVVPFVITVLAVELYIFCEKKINKWIFKK